MARLIWGANGERFYETGVDRTVLYVGDAAGVVWNGITAISEEPNGGEPTPYYIDGVKYLNLSSAEEYEATLEAFSYPQEFGPCDGTLQIAAGLFVTQQPRRSFSLAYRTLVGNDAKSAVDDYKLHLVYNALAAPSTRSNVTVGETPEPLGLSWGITVKPPVLSGYKPTAHLVVDSRLTDPMVLASLEDILYGLQFVDARMPTQTEVRNLFGGA